MPGEGSFLARCALKFSEVLAAGVATGLSGYVVAHLAGYVAGPMFSISQPPPTQGPVRPAANVGGAAATLPQPAPINDSTPHRPSKSQAKLVEPAAVAPARPKISISPSRSKLLDTRAAETVPRPQGAAGRKPETAESLEARVRAALARSNADVPRPQLQAPSVVPRALRDVEPGPPAPAVGAPAEDAPGPGASAPSAAAPPPQWRDTGPQPAEARAPPISPNLPILATQMGGRSRSGQNPGPQDPAGQNPAGQNSGGQDSAIQLPPLETAVVKSQPNVGTDSHQPGPASEDAHGPHEAQGSGPFSTFARMLRSDRPLPDDQAPRPPIAVGQ